MEREGEGEGRKGKVSSWLLGDGRHCREPNSGAPGLANGERPEFEYMGARIEVPMRVDGV